MEPSLTRGEYWLLETIVECSCPLCFLDSENYDEPAGIEMMFNKPGHGLNRTRLIEALARLFQEGLVEAVRNERSFALTREQIVAALAERPPLRNPSCTCYRLTRKGGAVWEAFAAPDWERFLKEELDEDTQTGSVTCMTSWRVEKYLRYVNLVAYEIDLQSVHLKDVGPWEATYWRVIPSGHQAHFRWLGEIDQSPDDELSWLAFCGFCDFRDEWCHWR